MRLTLTIVAALSCAMTFAQDITAKLTDKAIVLEGGGALGKLELSYPKLGGSSGGERKGPTGVKLDGNKAALTYADGGQIALTLNKDNVAFSFVSAPGGLKDYQYQLLIPLDHSKGSSWKIGDKEGAFPAERGKTKLYQGNTGSFMLASADKKKLWMLFPETFSWTELQDYREWNWQTFGLVFVTPYNADKKVIVVPFGSSLEAVKKVHVEPPADSGGAAAKPKVNSEFAARLNDKGVGLACGNMGVFELPYPKITIDGAKAGPIEKRTEGNKAFLKYKNNGAAELELFRDKYVLTFTQIPGNAKNIHLEMFIPFTFCDVGKWRIDGTEGTFPKEKKPGGKLFQGHSKRLMIADVNNSQLNIEVPENSYLELQDNREWGWNIFWFSASKPLTPDNKTFTVKFNRDVSGYKQAKLVDAFGQIPRDFPGKVKSEDELKQDVATENAYYNSLQKMPYKTNNFGGLAGSGQKLGLKKTGFFHVEKKADGKWVLVDPAGDAFFHLGVCTFGAGGEDATLIEGRREAFEWLPPREGAFKDAWNENSWWNSRAVSFYKANVIRKYGAYDRVTHTERLIDRVKKLGFNSGGAFSGSSDIFRTQKFPYVSTLPLGKFDFTEEVPGVRGMFDPFAEKSITKMDELFSKSVAKNADEPLIIGYFLANEQGMEDIPRAIPALNGKHPCKVKLIEMLQNKYKTIDAFNQAWNMKEASFDALKDKGLPVTTKAAFADMQAYTEFFIDAYCALITKTFRKYDKNHMLIGNRWQPSTANNEILCRVTGKYMDVISVNYYCLGVDASFIRRIYDWTGGKPQFWSEFFFTAEKESNVAAFNADMGTQALRGQAYRYYIETAASLGFVVGIEWFTLLDQAATGRFFEGFNGERTNTGLFNVADRPYKDMFVEMNKAHTEIYDVWLNGKMPFVLNDPRISANSSGTKTVTAAHPVGAIKIDGKLDGWPLRPPEMIPSSRVTMGRDANGLEGGFKVAWDDKFLYLLVTVTDNTPMINKQTKPDRYWNGDCIELFIGSENVEKGGPLLFSDRHILINASGDNMTYVGNVAQQPALETAVVPAIGGKGYTVEAKIPWSVLDTQPKEGQQLLFDIGIGNSDGDLRNVQIMWNGRGRNSSDRSAWGRLKLVP